MTILLQYAPGADIAGRPIRIGQTGNRYAVACRCMDKLVIPKIDAKVADAAAACVEKHKIAGLKIALGNRNACGVLLLANAG